MKRKISINSQSEKVKISKIESTNEKLTSRGGLFFLNEYLENIGIISRLSHKFKYLKDSAKGLSVENYFKQLFSFIFDGTKLNLTYFDELKKDEAYSELLKLSMDELATSHQIKRLTGKFKDVSRHIDIFRNLLLDIFINNLISEQPEVIEIGIDTMVLNNDDSTRKEGCSPTYKGVKGFQPFQVYWNGIIIDAIFREGKCHSNHGNDVKTTLKKIVKKIRKCYSKSVPIIIKMDSGFMSDENFTYFEDVLKVHFVCVGKMYDSIKDYIGELPGNERHEYTGTNVWDYIEFGNRLNIWDKFYRAIYLQQKNESLQYILDFASSDSIIYTNIGMDSELSAHLSVAIEHHIDDPEYIIKEYHKRGSDELCNRAFKDFATRENLPFQGFDQNQAFYYLLVLSHVLLQSYVKDICYDILFRNSYPTTIRRRLIDFAGKFVFHARKIVLKVSFVIFNRLKLNILWERCSSHQRQFAYI